MMKYMGKIFVCSVCMNLLLAATVSAQRDKVMMQDGKSQSGQIVGMSPTEVKAMIRGRETSLDVSSIRYITFEKEPQALRALRDALADGQLQQAQQAFERVDASKIDRAEVKQEIEFLQAQLMALQAKEGAITPGEAKTAMSQFRQRYPQNWRSASAMAVLGELAMQTADYKTAATTYARLRKISTGVTKLRSIVRSADALRLLGDNKNAINMYKIARSQPATTPAEARQKQLATVGAMAVAAAGGQAEQAIKGLKNIIDTNDASDVELFGKAYNALGDCYRITKRPTEAALQYLHTDLLFYRDTEVHAESLFWLSKLWDELGKSQRAMKARDMLKSRYLNSPWTKKL